MPFDDDNLRVLLEKVKRGRFNIPAYVPAGAQELIRGMVDVNPKTRLTVSEWEGGVEERERVHGMFTIATLHFFISFISSFLHLPSPSPLSSPVSFPLFPYCSLSLSLTHSLLLA